MSTVVVKPRCVDYLSKVLWVKEREETIRNAVETIKPDKKKFDAILMRGTSGLLIGVPLAYKLKKDMMIVRKTAKETSHSYQEIEGLKPNSNFIIVDDLIASGETVFTMLETARDFMPSSKCVGIYLYFKELWSLDPYNFIKEKTYDIERLNRIFATPSKAWSNG